MPISAVVGPTRCSACSGPGQHGSTFGGNPLACAVALEVLELLADGSLAAQRAPSSASASAVPAGGAHPAVAGIRQRGLWIGVDIHDGAPTARTACERLQATGVLAKETQERTIRFAPPLTISGDELDWLLERVNPVLADA